MMILAPTSKRVRCDKCRPEYEREQALDNYYKHADETNKRLREQTAARVADKKCARCGEDNFEFYVNCKKCRKAAYKRARKSHKLNKRKREERARIREATDFDRRWDRLFKPEPYDIP